MISIVTNKDFFFIASFPRNGFWNDETIEGCVYVYVVLIYMIGNRVSKTINEFNFNALGIAVFFKSCGALSQYP